MIDLMADCSVRIPPDRAEFRVIVISARGVAGYVDTETESDAAVLAGATVLGDAPYEYVRVVRLSDGDIRFCTKLGIPTLPDELNTIPDEWSVND